MQGALRITQRRSQRDIGVRAVVVALDVLQPRCQLGERCLVHGPTLLHAASRVGAKPLQRPRGARHADHRHEQLFPEGHRVERGENLLEREIPCRPEEYQRVRSVRIHAPALFSACPPNS